jgi:hypothetical protein
MVGFVLLNALLLESSFQCDGLFSHHSPKGELFIIFSSMGTRQSDPFIKPLFVLVHFCVL